MFEKIGHRGAPGHDEPENTFNSFYRALKLGATAIEFDVRSTQDGELIVFHDQTLDRTTNGAGLVRKHPLRYIESLRTIGGERVPHFKDVLSTFGALTRLHIELKEGNLQKRTLAWIRKYNLIASVVVSAFDGSDMEVFSPPSWLDLLRMKRVEPSLKIALLVRSEIDLERALLINEYVYPGWIYAINPSSFLVNPPRVQRIQKSGAQAFVWTVNDPEEIARLKGWGVNGIYSDYPDRL